MVASGKVGPPDRPGEQGVAHEEVLAGLLLQPDLQADAAGTMARCVMRRGHALAERDDLAGRKELIDRRLRFDRQSELPAHLNRPLVEEQVVAMQVDRHVERALGGRDTGHMVNVTVGQEDVPNRELPPAGDVQQFGDLVAGIDEHGLTGVRARHQEAVLEERRDRARLDYDHEVILAILDDLLFTSKVKAAAAHVGVPITFARSSDAALAEMRSSPPRLVILDLNNPRTDPLGTVGQMKADPQLTRIPIVGFASHVQADVIEAARKAGADDVLARSAFTQRLPEILARAL
jgi:CheY-like chemotaxis protein